MLTAYHNVVNEYLEIVTSDDSPRETPSVIAAMSEEKYPERFSRGRAEENLCIHFVLDFGTPWPSNAHRFHDCSLRPYASTQFSRYSHHAGC